MTMLRRLRFGTRPATGATHVALSLVLAGALWLTGWSAVADTSTEEANIARMTASLLEQSHFSARRGHEDFSGKFLDRYLDMLDGGKMLFLKSDLEDFSVYRATLSDLTLKLGDTSPAKKIFTRYLQRLEQRVEFAKDVLNNDKFDFTTDEKFLTDREHAERPSDIEAAHQLWRQSLKYEYLQEKLGDKKPAEIVETLTKRYERTLRTMKKFHDDQIFEAYLTALAHVYDPHSDYMGPRQLEDFRISMSLSLCGIGAVLQSIDGYCKIRELLPGGPAIASKQIKPGDRITTVQQEGEEPVDIVEMPLTDAVQLIRGAKGTKVILTLIPADSADSSARKTLTLVRDEIKLETQEAKARVVDLPVANGKTLRVGVLDLPSFYTGDGDAEGKGHAGCTADVAKLLQKLKAEKIQGLILDLRNNGGGSLEEAIRLTGLFIEFGPVVQTKDAEGRVGIERDPDATVMYDGPLVVLTSRMSASASEILAGALQDYGRAPIIGDPSTFGKGTVQSMVTLDRLMKKFGLDGGENPGALKLTIRKFYRPGGASTQLKGVIPDIILPSASAQLKIGEAEMPESLPWDEVPGTNHARLDRVAPYLATLKEKSTERLAADQEFTWLREDIERFKKRIANPEVSLNEKERRQEKTEQEERKNARKQARANRKPLEQTQYEITLKNAGSPGLPAPMMAKAARADLVATAEAKVDDGEDSADDKENPLPDIILEEAKRILADYIPLVPGKPPEMTASHPAEAKPDNAP